MEEILLMIQRVTVFVLVAGVFTNLFAGTEYKKYLQFATGLMVIALVLAPIMSALGKEVNFSKWLEKEIVDQKLLEKKEEIELLGEEYEKEIRKSYMEMITNYEVEENGGGS